VEQPIEFVPTRLVNTKKEKKLREKPSTGPAWTSYEAFNHILAAQVKVIMKKMKLKADFRDAALGIWMTYLSKCEVSSSCLIFNG